MRSAQLNRAWRAAVRSPNVYELRAKASNSQTIVTVPQFECIISLYDTATGTWHRLPRPPFKNMGVARGCGCVTLRGKLYVLGGNGKHYLPRDDVHVFDLAGKGQWKQCASMKNGRKHFACAAYDGKIYVFGGAGAGNAAEVYDPDQDLWCDVAPMLSHRIEHKVVIIGNVFCVHMGRFFELDRNGKSKWNYAHFAEIYDPHKDHWTQVANFAIDGSCKEKGVDVAEAAVVIDGRLHGILDDWLYVYGEPLNSFNSSESLSWDGSGSWKAVQPISWDIFLCPATPSFNPYARVALAITNERELVALVFGRTGSPNNNRRWTFLKSNGLGSVGQTLTWQRIERTALAKAEGFTVSSWIDEVPDFQFSPCMSSLAGPW